MTLSGIRTVFHILLEAIHQQAFLIKQTEGEKVA